MSTTLVVEEPTPFRPRPAQLPHRRPSLAPKAGLLADAKWERVRDLLPTHKPGQGRPRRDDRQVLGAILWVMDTGSSWRDLPEEEFGPNSTAHGRYRKWCKEGLWSRIVETLGR
jgi:transposase